MMTEDAMEEQRRHLAFGVSLLVSLFLVQVAPSNCSEISGTIIDADTGQPVDNGTVYVWDSGGGFVSWATVHGGGAYTTMTSIPPGDYFVEARVFPYLHEMYPDDQCFCECDRTDGEPVTVDDEPVVGVDFEVDLAGGWVTGSFIDASTGEIPENATVEIYTSSGEFCQGPAYIDPFDPGYTSHGLPEGTYYARTTSPPNTFLNEIYDNIPCHPDCDVTDGDSFTVGGGSETTGIDFEIEPLNPSLRFLALGDSYSSGEGAGRYRIDINEDGDTNDLWNGVLRENTGAGNNRCHRSAYAWSGQQPGNNEDASAPSEVGEVSRLLVACSGAVFQDLYFPYSRQHDGANFDEIAQLDHHDEMQNADLVSLTIGGNDIGFKKLIIACGTLPDSTCELFIDDAFDRISYFYHADGFKNAYQDVRNAELRNKPVYVMGYPQVISDDEIIDPWCLSYHGWGISQIERIRFRSLVEELNLAIECAAEAAGVHYVDVDFSNHEACSIQEDWINFLRSDLQESFHPNKRGQIEYARALGRATRNGIAPNPSPVDPPGNPDCSQLNKLSVRNDNNLGDLAIEPAVQPLCDSMDQFAPGDELRLFGSGFGPDSSISLEFYSNEGEFVSELPVGTADGDGVLDVIRTLPGGAPDSGPGLFLATGPNQSGGTQSSFGPVFLASSSTSDSDSDGVPDVCDNCPNDENAGQEDLDEDHTGDVCDPCPDDFDNDLDGDGLCADVDPCPLDPYNDIDGDGVCGEIDMMLYDGFETGDTSLWSATIE
jgi:hypothetical protein